MGAQADVQGEAQAEAQGDAQSEAQSRREEPAAAVDYPGAVQGTSEVVEAFAGTQNMEVVQGGSGEVGKEWEVGKELCGSLEDLGAAHSEAKDEAVDVEGAVGASEPLADHA